MTKKSERSALALNIINRREAKGWSQGDLAHKVGVHVNTIKSIETDKNEGEKETRIAITGALGCTMSDLYKEVEETIESPPKELSSAERPHPPLTAEQTAERLLELDIVLHKYARSLEEQRLLTLYILTLEELYLTQYEALPSGDPQVAAVLRRSLGTS